MKNEKDHRISLDKERLLIWVEEERQKFVHTPPFLEGQYDREFLFPVLKNMVRNGRRYDTNKDNVINEIVHFLFGMETRQQGFPYRRNVVSIDADRELYGKKSNEYFEALYPQIPIETLVGLGQNMWNGYLGHDLYQLVKWADIEVHQKNGDMRIGQNNYFIHNTRQLDEALTVKANEMALVDIILSDTTESNIATDLKTYDGIRMRHSDMMMQSTSINLKEREKIKLSYHKKGSDGKTKYFKTNLSKNDSILKGGKKIIAFGEEIEEIRQKTDDQDSYYDSLREILKGKLPHHDQEYIDEIVLHNKLLTGTKGRKVNESNKVETYTNDMNAIFKYAIDRYDDKDHKFHDSYKDILIAKYTDLIDNTVFYTELAEPKQHDRAMKNMSFLKEARQFFFHILESGGDIPLELLWLHDKLVTKSIDLASDIGDTFDTQAKKADEYRRKADAFQEIRAYFRAEQNTLTSIFSNEQKQKASDSFLVNPSGTAR